MNQQESNNLEVGEFVQKKTWMNYGGDAFCKDIPFHELIEVINYDNGAKTFRFQMVYLTGKILEVTKRKMRLTQVELNSDFNKIYQMIFFNERR